MTQVTITNQKSSSQAPESSQELGAELRDCRAIEATLQGEILLPDWLNNSPSIGAVLVAEGFEERSLGLLKKLSDQQQSAEEVYLGRYTANPDLNTKFRPDFERYAHHLSNGSRHILSNENDGRWIAQAISSSKCERFLIDITGISHAALFPLLDIASNERRHVTFSYTEATQYWPTKDDWTKLTSEANATDPLSHRVEELPFLFDSEHSVEYVPGHEGYDSGVSGRALVAFLPFKSARLAAILGNEDFSERVFIAGLPRLQVNEWRLEALRSINESLIQTSKLVTIPTFGIRNTVRELSSLLLGTDGTLLRFDVHLAILGSKLQTVGCWIVSCAVPAITVVTSSPKRYFPEAFSSGIGETWTFTLPKLR